MKLDVSDLVSSGRDANMFLYHVQTSAAMVDDDDDDGAMFSNA